ncbi:MAG: BatD family protein [Pseudomonadales bacterium]|nr:BatD family protein [Pseudomonadales bacterium]
MVNPILQLTTTFVFLLLSSLSLAANTPVTAKLDRSIININETANLILQGEKDVKIPIDALRQLQANFDIQHKGNNSQTSCRNFSCTSTVTSSYQLSPKHIGLFSIPAMKINGVKTQVLQLKVKPANNNPKSAHVDPVFIETIIDKTEAYVQEQILLTFKINNSIELRDLSLEQEFLVDDAIIKLINQTNYERQINGRLYNTAELSYAVLAQKSGTLTIPSINIQAVVSRGGFRTQRLRLRSDEKIITVKANPTNSSHWLPAKHLRISETWSDDITQIQQGDSITRTITTTAAGLSAEQLPPIKIKASRHFKAYPDQAKMEDKHNAQGIVGVRTDSIAIVASKVGEIELPAIEIEWWDVNQQKISKAILPAITLTVIPNPDAAPTPAAPASQIPAQPVLPAPVQSQGNSVIAETKTSQTLYLWQAAFAISLICAIVFAALYFRSLKQHQTVSTDNNKPSTSVDLTEAFKKLQQTCQGNDAAAVRQALLQWAKLNWPRQAINSSQDIVHLVKNSALKGEIKKLDAVLFSNQTAGSDFNDLFNSLSTVSQKKTASAQKNLAELYPVN